MATLSELSALEAPRYRHEALLYSGDAGFVEATVPFVRDGLEADEPVLVAVQRHKIELLKDALDGEARRVDFLDMGDIGRNPARIIPAWRAFLDARPPSRPARGVGEPIWRGRSPEELVECQLHESLLNVAVDSAEPFWLLCPYDVGALDGHVIDEAHRSHPRVAGRHRSSTAARRYNHSDPQQLSALLPPAPDDAFATPFSAPDLRGIRDRVRVIGLQGGLDDQRVSDLELAVSEAAANSIRYGGGGGRVRMWIDAASVICEVSDEGRLTEPMAGRIAPDLTGNSGRGLWLVNQLCDLVQVRVHARGTVVRLHVAR